MSGGAVVGRAVKKQPNVIKELIIATSLGVLVGGIYKWDCWRDKKKVREFYQMLERGEISVVVEEE